MNMKYIADINVEDNSGDLFSCLSSEVSNEERTKVSIAVKGKLLCVHIECKDAVALRAACNSITRLIHVFENAGKAGRKNDEQHQKRNAGKNKPASDD